MQSGSTEKSVDELLVIKLVHNQLLRLPAKRRLPVADYIRGMLESSVQGDQVALPETGLP